MADSVADRLGRAIAGEAVEPPVAGLSFVPPGVLPGLRGDPASAPAPALARTCEDAGLDFAFVPSWEDWADAAVIELHARGVAALWVVPGVLWPALERTGVEEGLRASALDPDRLAPHLDRAADGARDAIVRGLGLRADGIVVADDLAGASGPVVAPDFAAGEVFPRMARLLSLAVRSGVPRVLHCDGDARVFLPRLRRSGFLALHGDCGGAGVERMVTAARSEGVAMLGGLPTAALSSQVAALRAGAEAGILARRGGLVVADDGGVTTGEQVACLLAGIAAARR